MLNNSNNAANNILNETLILDEQRFKEFLTSKQSRTILGIIDFKHKLSTMIEFQPTTKKDGATKCEETSKCVNIVPHFVPPTFPWIIRKEPRKPIVYIESLVCDDAGKDAEPIMVASAASVSQTRRRKPIDEVRTNTGRTRSRVLKNARKRQRAGTAADYVLTSKSGAAPNKPRSMYPLKYFHNMDYVHSAYESDPWADYSSEYNE